MRFSPETWIGFIFCIPGAALILASRADGNPILGGVGVLIIISVFMWIGGRSKS